MKHSFKLCINKQRIRKDYTAAIFFRVVINRKLITVPVELYWHKDYFDEINGKILPRTKNDKLHDDYTLQIDRTAGEINDVFIWAMLAKKELTIESFKTELKNKNSRADFIAFWEKELNERLKMGKIRASTAKSQKNSLESLCRFRPKIMFSEISKKLLDDYKARLYNIEKLEPNSVWTKFKDFRTYLNLAMQSGNTFDYPFTGYGFKMPKLTNRLEYLQESEFQRFKSYFYSTSLDEGHETTLRAFLFSCYTGLRISDVKNVFFSNISDDILSFRPVKQSTEIMKEVKVPLCKEAKRLIVNKKKNLVDTCTDQVMNRVLKTISTELGINKDVTFHWARHTFAKRFLDHGGRLEVLQQILGHADIKTTMIYVHVDEARMWREIKMLT